MFLIRTANVKSMTSPGAVSHHFVRNKILFFRIFELAFPWLLCPPEELVVSGGSSPEEALVQVPRGQGEDVEDRLLLLLALFHFASAREPSVEMTKHWSLMGV